MPPPAGSGVIEGVVMNRDQEVYEGARVELSLSSEPAPRQTTTDSNGRFRFAGLPAGNFTAVVSAAGFKTAKVAGILRAGESLEVPAIVLSLAETSTDVEVSASRQEIATEEVKLEEKQRVLGFIPNFYVVYDAHPAPLSPRQKFSLAWHDSIDPITILSAGFFAGIEQAQNTFVGYGPGAQGYAKRFGADYADGFSSDMLGGALFPSLLHQDPRYYYKGTGSIASRTLHAVAMSFLCKGDNGHWQFDYSALAGNLAAGGISNLYYPSTDRNNLTVILDSTAIGMGEDAIGNIFQEFVVRKLTPVARKQPAP
ncbi:MAG: carboxypeptidase-like regulatory domain-containing protein [Terracidiphilus sp.]